METIDQIVLFSKNSLIIKEVDMLVVYLKFIFIIVTGRNIFKVIVLKKNYMNSYNAFFKISFAFIKLPLIKGL